MSYDLERVSVAEKLSKQSILKSVILLIAMISVCIITKSIGLLADIIFTVASILASLALMNGFRISLKPADNKHHYGYAKAESVTAAFLAVSLIFISFFTCYISVRALIYNSSHGHGNDIYAVIVLCAAIITKEYSYMHAKEAANKINSSAVLAKAWYLRNAALSSIAALLGILGSDLGFEYLDSIAAILVSIFIFRMGFIICRSSMVELMDIAPDIGVIKEIEATAYLADGVTCIKGIKARKNGAGIIVDMEICIDKYLTKAEGAAVIENVKEDIKKNIQNITSITIESHIE